MLRRDVDGRHHAPLAGLEGGQGPRVHGSGKNRRPVGRSGWKPQAHSGCPNRLHKNHIRQPRAHPKPGIADLTQDVGLEADHAHTLLLAKAHLPQPLVRLRSPIQAPHDEHAARRHPAQRSPSSGSGFRAVARRNRRKGPIERHAASLQTTLFLRQGTPLSPPCHPLLRPCLPRSPTLRSQATLIRSSPSENAFRRSVNDSTATLSLHHGARTRTPPLPQGRPRAAH